MVAVFLLAPTVPSEPRPKKTARTREESAGKSIGTSRELFDTSSTMPTTDWRTGHFSAASVKTAAAIAGVNSLLDSP